MTFKRWLPTFLAFPVGGFLAIETVGSVHGPVSAAAGGLLAGAVIGAGQWLALRRTGIGARWIGATAAAMAAGAALAALITDAGTGQADVVLAGAVTGAVVGAVQSTLLRERAALWTAATATAWALGWLITSEVIVDLDRGHHVFGSSGAIAATVLTGLALRRVPAVAGA
jgi:hypothetical protein